MTPRPGGEPRWLPICGMALAVGLIYLAIFAVPPLITTFVDDLGRSHAEAGALMSVCLGGFLLASLVSGRFAARFGAVRVVVAGLLLCAIGTLCFPIGDTFGVWLLCRVAIGIAGGLVYAPGITLVTSLLPPERANVGVGVFLCGLSVGGTVAYFATRLISDASSWRWPFVAFGIAVAAGSVLVGVAGRGVMARRVAAVSGAYGVALRDPTMRLLYGCLFLALFVGYGVFTWIPPYLDESAGLTSGQISSTSALMTLAGIPATFGFGWLADRFGRPFAVASLGLALPVLLVAFAVATAPSHAGATAISTLSALGVSGGLGPLYALPPLILSGAAGAAASGLAAAAAMGGAVTSTYLGGWIVGATDGYTVPFWMYAAAAVATAALLIPLVGRSARAQRALAA